MTPPWKNVESLDKKDLKTNQDLSKLVKTGQNWLKLVKTGQKLSKLVAAFLVQRPTGPLSEHFGT